MSDETTSVWADIWAKAKVVIDAVKAWPKSASGALGFALGLATRMLF